MKANKAKSTKKNDAKANKRVAKKELEASISDKFVEAISNLGQDAGKFAKEIKKATKQLAKKLADKFQDVKESVGDTFETKAASTKNIKRPVKISRPTPSKSVIKAEKVVARVTKANAEERPKRAYNRRVVASSSEQNAIAAKPVTSALAGKQAIKKTTTSRTSQRTTALKGKATPSVNSIEKNGQQQDENNNPI